MPRISAGEEVDYVTQIKPILAARCYACHSALRKKSGLRLDTAAALIEGGDRGPAVVPGKSAESLLIDMITGESGTRMPPEDEGAALTAEQIALFKKWIDEGAHAPAETPLPDPRDHWAYQPPARPAVPQVRRTRRGFAIRSMRSSPPSTNRKDSCPCRRRTRRRCCGGCISI